MLVFQPKVVHSFSCHSIRSKHSINRIFSYNSNRINQNSDHGSSKIKILGRYLKKTITSLKSGFNKVRKEELTASDLEPYKSGLSKIGKSIFRGTREGSFESRGEHFLYLELAISLTILLGFPSLVKVAVKTAAVLLGALGTVLFCTSMWEMRNVATVYMAPLSSNVHIIRSGPFEFVRHPQYGGTLLIFLSAAVLSGDLYRLLAWIALALLIVSTCQIDLPKLVFIFCSSLQDQKATKEEEYLHAKFATVSYHGCMYIPHNILYTQLYISDSNTQKHVYAHRNTPSTRPPQIS